MLVNGNAPELPGVEIVISDTIKRQIITDDYRRLSYELPPEDIFILYYLSYFLTIDTDLKRIVDDDYIGYEEVLRTWIIHYPIDKFIDKILIDKKTDLALVTNIKHQLIKGKSEIQKYYEFSECSFKTILKMVDMIETHYWVTKIVAKNFQVYISNLTLIVFKTIDERVLHDFKELVKQFSTQPGIVKSSKEKLALDIIVTNLSELEITFFATALEKENCYRIKYGTFEQSFKKDVFSPYKQIRMMLMEIDQYQKGQMSSLKEETFFNQWSYKGKGTNFNHFNSAIYELIPSIKANPKLKPLRFIGKTRNKKAKLEINFKLFVDYGKAESVGTTRKRDNNRFLNI